ncbi:MAG: radical SAM protein [Omnitrophica WOR_2 bacterium]
MELTGLHFLLTYRCTFECDHCFAWGSPWQSIVFHIDDIRRALEQAKNHPSIRTVYFEGGEPFLYYPVLVESVRMAAEMGFGVGIVSNAYWAASEKDALKWLAPLAGLVQDLTVSSDLFHYNEKISRKAQNASMAALKLGIATGMITIEKPEALAPGIVGQLPEGESGVMYRGRAAEKLAAQTRRRPWNAFTTCPHEDLRSPGRVHLDPLGNLHICQGLVIGNIFTNPLDEICQTYMPENHPVIGRLLEGGPSGLVTAYGLAHEESVPDACYLCYRARQALRPRFPEYLAPDAMYGVF